MKNLINYYYGILVNDFKKTNDSYVFFVEGINYEFLPFYGDINQFYDNYLIVLNLNNYCHEIIFNKDKGIITLYNDKPYLLLKKNNFNKNILEINDIINYDYPVFQNRNFNWKKLWIEKIDYYEYQMSQFAFKYKIIKESFDYYIGLSENAINLLNYVDDREIKYYISHKRINFNERIDEFFNPINIIIDNRTRDIAEYIKINLLNDSININDVINIFNNINLNYTECILLFARLLYPSYYFDIYDGVIQGKNNEEEVNFYIKKIPDYEIFLKEIYNFFIGRYKIPEIEWLKY